jgi:hypothetical protein
MEATHAPDDFLRSKPGEAGKSLLTLVEQRSKKQESEKGKEGRTYQWRPPLLANTGGPACWTYGPPKEEKKAKQDKKETHGKQRGETRE